MKPPQPPAPEVRGYEGWCVCCGRLLWQKPRAVPKPNICFSCWEAYEIGVEARQNARAGQDTEAIAIAIPRYVEAEPYAASRTNEADLERAIASLYPRDSFGNHLVPRSHNIPALLGIVGQLLANAYAAGYRSGSGLLLRLADGKASVDDYDRLRPS